MGSFNRSLGWNLSGKELLLFGAFFGAEEDCHSSTRIEDRSRLARVITDSAAELPWFNRIERTRIRTGIDGEQFERR